MKNSKDSVYYIRTGNKVSQPFRIGWITKSFLIAFMAYFTYITYEFFRVYYLEGELTKTELSITNKYLRASAYEALIDDAEYASDISDKTIKLYEGYNGESVSRKPEESK